MPRKSEGLMRKLLRYALLYIILLVTLLLSGWEVHWIGPWGAVFGTSIIYIVLMGNEGLRWIMENV